MAVTTLEGIVENGQIRLLTEAKLPEHVRVYVVVPDAGAPPTRVSNPRLAHPEQAADFEKEVFEEGADAGV